jgi:hypothetical protein
MNKPIENQTPVKSVPRIKTDVRTIILTALLFFSLGGIVDYSINRPVIMQLHKQIYLLKLDTAMKATEIRNLVNWKQIENTGNAKAVRTEINSQRKKRLKK